MGTQYLKPRNGGLGALITSSENAIVLEQWLQPDRERPKQEALQSGHGEMGLGYVEQV